MNRRRYAILAILFIVILSLAYRHSLEKLSTQIPWIGKFIRERETPPSLGFWAVHYRAGGGWGSPTRVETNGRMPDVAVDDIGDTIAVWRGTEGTDIGIWASRHNVHTGWSTPTIIIRRNIKTSAFPQVSVGNKENLILVWRQKEGDRSEVGSSRQGSTWGTWAGRFVIGQELETPTRIDSNIEGLEILGVSADRQGNATVVWGQFEDHHSFQSMWASHYTGSWTRPVKIDGALGETSLRKSFVDVAINQHGNIVAVWQEEDKPMSHTYTIWANWALDGKRWSTPTKISTSSVTDPKPRIAVNENGNAIVVWESIEGRDYLKDPHTIQASRYVSGIGWSKPIRIDANIGGSSSGVTIDASGNAIAVWHKFDRDIGVGFKVYAARDVFGKGWDAPVLLTSPGKHGLFPRVVGNGRGDAIVIWEPDILP